MGFQINVRTSAGKPIPYDLCSEALTSSSPPLSGESKTEIARIRSSRVETLEGVNRYQADKIFDLIDTLPPFEGPRTARLMRLLADSDFSYADFESALDELVNRSKKRGPSNKENEWGFISMPAVPDQSGERLLEPGQIDIDSKKSTELGASLMAEIYLGLATIDDAAIRQGIITDLSNIVRLRFSFDFTKK